MSKKNDERFKNLILFKCYATDEEMAETMPFLAIFLIVVIVLVVIYLCLSK